MARTMHRDGSGGLERSCMAHDWIRVDGSRPGFERVEAHFATHAFAPHRHDTYTIGITLSGVQAFAYRGTRTYSGPGKVFVLHPDELHDGRAGTKHGYAYRAIYVAPRLIQAALGRSSLPFLRGGVTGDLHLRAAVLAGLDDPRLPPGDLHLDNSLVRIADALAALDPSGDAASDGTPDQRAVSLARDFLDAHVLAPVASRTLERLTGLSRFTLTRHFRAVLGTSPHRYVVMRRLDRARRLIRTGAALAEVAVASGFADQAHMTRHFTKTYGVSPSRWRALQR